jgi:hypothetical protein
MSYGRAQRIFGTVPVDIGDAEGRRKEREDAIAKEFPGIVDPDLKRRLIDADMRKEEERRAYMAPADELGLPPLLEAKRQQYFIPDSYFQVEPLFDRILIFQIPQHVGETSGKDSKIIRPEATKEDDLQRSPRGIIISMGMLARDQLKSNGTQEGDTVHIQVANPFHRPVEVINGFQYYVLVLRAGDLIDNEDLRTRMRAGEVTVGVEKTDGRIVHVLTDKDGTRWYPELPWIGEDM